MTKTSVSRITKLKSSQDYREWIRDIKFYTDQFGLWPHCDPVELTPPPVPINPVPLPTYNPARPTDFVSQRSAWKFFQDKVDKYNHNLSKVNLAITQSVNRSLRGIYLDKESPRDILIALKEALEPTIHMQRAWLQEQYEQLKKTPSNTKTTEYFHKWRLLANKAASYTDYITQYDMTVSLFNALQTIMPAEVAARKAMFIDSRDPPNIFNQLTFFEQLCMVNYPDGKFKGKTLEGNFATFQN